MTGRSGPAPGRGGKVRPARLTDLSALGELSRLAQAEGTGARSLGLPLAGPPIGVFTLFRLPLGAFRPNDLLYVHELDGHVGGLLRVERDSARDEWTIVELDAIGLVDAGDIRYRMVQACLRDGSKRGAARFHVACADVDGNVELFMQAGFMRYGERAGLLPAVPPAVPGTAHRGRIRRARDPDRRFDGRGGPLSPVRQRDARAGGAPGDAAGSPTGSGTSPGRSCRAPA